MSKLARNVKKLVKKVDHKGRVFTYIPSQLANPAPPLGSQLGQVGVNIAAFVKDFNLKTSVYKPGVPIPCTVTVNPDRSYNLHMDQPPFSYFLMQAAGIQRGAMEHTNEVSGWISRKHVYEIAKIKSTDTLFQMVDLQDLCQRVIDEAHTIGIKVVDEIDPKAYAKFLAEREVLIEEQLDEIKTAREAKLLRMAATASAS